MATPAERFGLLPITVDAASIRVDAEHDRRGQWIVRRVASNGVMLLDNQLFSMTKEKGHDRDHACRGAGRPGPARGTSDPRAAGPGAAPRLGAHPGQGVWDQSLRLHTRLGLAQGVTFPRVLGIEAAGVVAAAPGGEFEEGQQVTAMMGGMGRTFDGGYAEFTSVPATQVIPFRSELGWATLGAIPEMVQTAHGSLTVGLDAQPGQTLLIRGGTSSVGMATAILAKNRGLTVLSTRRQPDRVAALKAIGVDHVLLDDGDVAARARAIVPDGVEAAIELVGTNTLPDTLRATAVHGVVCFTGMLSNQWTVADFYPIEYIPTGVRLTAYGGDAADLPTDVLQAYLDAVAAGRLTVPIHRTYALDEIAQAHADMEHGRATGKLVVLP